MRCPHSCWLQLSIAAASALINAASRSLAADAFGDDPAADPFGEDAPIDALWKVLQYIGNNADCQMGMVTIPVSPSPSSGTCVIDDHEPDACCNCLLCSNHYMDA